MKKKINKNIFTAANTFGLITREINVWQVDLVICLAGIGFCIKYFEL
jgi:hypothetical protein